MGVLDQAPADAREALLDASGFRRHVVEIPPPELHRSTCGRCGGRLLAPDGATHTLCEQCGEIFDAARPRFACPSCGATVIAAQGQHLHCAYCETRFMLSS